MQKSSGFLLCVFCALAVLPVPQFYIIPVGAVFLSVCFVFGCLSFFWLGALRNFFDLKWFRALILVFVSQFFSLFWSPDYALGIRNILYASLFLGALSVGYIFALDRRILADRFIKWGLWVSVLQAVLVIFFRLSPSIESSFINSFLIKIFTSSNAVDALFSGYANNIFDDEKSGGMLLNANTASALLGFFCMLSWGFSNRPTMSSLRYVALINWVAVFFTGSKAGLAGAIMFPALLFVDGFLRRFSIPSRIVFLTLIAVFSYAFSSLNIIGYFQNSGVLVEAGDTYDIRKLIWGFAYQNFMEAPLLGLGYGGWELVFPQFAEYSLINPNLPPHNAFIIQWSQSGLVSCLFLLGFSFFYLAWLNKLIGSIDSMNVGMVRGLLYGVLWFWYQAMGENFGLIGEVHFTPILGLVSGYFLSANNMAAYPHRYKYPKGGI